MRTRPPFCHSAKLRPRCPPPPVFRPSPKHAASLAGPAHAGQALAAAKSLPSAVSAFWSSGSVPPAREEKDIADWQNRQTRLFPPPPTRAQNAPAFCLTLRNQPALFRFRSTNPVHCSVKIKTAPAERSSFVGHERQSLFPSLRKPAARLNGRFRAVRGWPLRLRLRRASLWSLRSKD